MIQASTPRLRAYSAGQLEQIPQLAGIGHEQRFEMRVVASVLPFRVNDYVCRELIDWDRVPEDPIFQLVFPQRGMLAAEEFERMAALHRRGAERGEIDALAREIRAGLNPHPAGQQALNVPVFDGDRLTGLQHKYRETVLFFPSQGQTCHSFCTFCFRWAQFIGDRELKFAERDATRLHAYLADHREVSDVLVTGGDPMVMRTKVLRGYLEALLAPEFDHVRTIRIGSKALTFWPQRFVSDEDADDLAALFERLVRGGKHVAFMAHLEHWRELETDVAVRAVRRLRDCGVAIRSQAPVLRHVNDCADTWARTWREQVQLGIVPYYMFVERDTGARGYFELPLARAHEIYRDAIKQVSGLARTARGPSMSCGPGKVEIQGVAEVAGEEVFVLRFIQARDPAWTNRPFFAKFDPRATWFDELVPAFGEREFFFESQLREIETVGVRRSEPARGHAHARSH
ncbi:KamA family radical SAM protein [Engelhardtia mirabilis]|uniref:L-lysine 2,3-aminomutase n=1 Tax=Engelhardtia mirabilis TaxID=2528011 RepID=A0A518BRC0_9BACT|nr:L-lysine 2,3-aminomutase [Planctomycetes bacterium Pla133]QDV03837.1 L-lysine 2,3-aminomutase [Planctomycetes bacterium Pla86]